MTLTLYLEGALRIFMPRKKLVKVFQPSSPTGKNKLTVIGSHFKSIIFKNAIIRTKYADKIYKSIYRPIIEYNHPIFLSYKETARKETKCAKIRALGRLTIVRKPANPFFPTRVTLHSTK